MTFLLTFALNSVLCRHLNGYQLLTTLAYILLGCVGPTVRTELAEQNDARRTKDPRVEDSRDHKVKFLTKYRCSSL